MPTERELAPSEWSVLGLLCVAPTHGWTLTRELSHEGEVGAIWTTGRPVVYRSLEFLEQRGLIRRSHTEPSPWGPPRVVFAPTVAGRKAFKRWLGEPVAHLRDMRPLFLLKLVLAQRAGVTPPPILDSQRSTFTAVVESLERELAESSGTARVLIQFRLESTRSALNFIDSLAADTLG
ncbi:MAG TPA: PadR family transcriptional regulator [Gaiellaceae bacterium]|nr:PadR family transcriptional regulator [Gaiellaceae bacterium]